MKTVLVLAASLFFAAEASKLGERLTAKAEALVEKKIVNAIDNAEAKAEAKEK